MEKFTAIHGLVVPIDRANVDTDAIIPKQFMKSIRRTGFGPNLFDEWRYRDRGEPGQDVTGRPKNADFALNEPRYQGANVLLTRENFGCGSSREHAAWALRDWGIRALIAPSFADIFMGNCYKNGMLPITLDATLVDRLFAAVSVRPGYAIDIDLLSQSLACPDGQIIHFELDPYRKQCLLDGADDIALTLRNAEAIRDYEEHRRKIEPWIFERPPTWR
ncbi:3-isopropylmalate dehydratase small subunit [Burkholderia sp. SG-MS1]|uniref:3-isopropylmalate dehydratase small subunit n=1 Tax=Paraburkholderia sp. SG-MS1 TaxID=2023741 RepID=UPI0014475443|nr:3-isopropylmalate dehydratase small subunit [Paraburkholderia sp. SG-MS1]NKJ50693.1 3-isopropylmalate dehydratase small subunit [Paraburkholderia sp. SG-MS1]